MRIIVIALGLLLFLIATPALAAKPNLVPNGSFESGFAGWDLIAVASPSLVAGRCGTTAASISNSFVRTQSGVIKRNRTYKMVFWYKGTVSVSVSSDDLSATDWTKATYTVKGENVGTHVWFMGFTGKPGVVDCVVLKRIN